MGAYPSEGAATLESLQAERDLISSHLDTLHEEMMRLALNKRRDRWEEYYTRLDGLARHKQKIETAIGSFTLTPMSAHPTSGARLIEAQGVALKCQPMLERRRTQSKF